MKYEAEILITLKDGVRDPQGAAIDTVLKRTGLEDDANVRAGKLFRLNVSAENTETAKEKVNKICEDLLLNPVLESYKIGRLEKL